MKDHHDKPGAIAIDKGVPIPPRKTSDGRPPVYPFRDMQVGDSFFAAKGMPTMSSGAASAAKATGYKFSCRSVTENGIEGTRVWRIA